MYYRYFTEKNNIRSGLFHPLPEWGVPKENGMYKIVPKYFESLPYHKTFQAASVSWFTEYGNTVYHERIEALKAFYSQYEVSVVCITEETPDHIADRDEYQIWCCSG